MKDAFEILHDPIQRAEYDDQCHKRSQEDIVCDEVTLKQLIRVEQTEISLHHPKWWYEWRCRCGDRFIIQAQDLTEGYDVFSCQTCCLNIRILANAV